MGGSAWYRPPRNSQQNPLHKQARRAKRALLPATALFLKDGGNRAKAPARVLDLPEGNEAWIPGGFKSWFPKAGVTGAEVAQLAVRNIQIMPNRNDLQIKAAFELRRTNTPFWEAFPLHER